MKTTCLINNYNYASYVLEAVDSALNQTVGFDEIVVVDDGSTDGSVELLEKNYASHPTVKLVLKQNGGQLSCFHQGLLSSSGEVIFFLDADDFYSSGYLEKALQSYEEIGCDFLFFSHKDAQPQKESVHHVYNKSMDLGYSVILATWANGNHYLGNVTSTLSIKRNFLEQIFPYPFVEDWRIQADLYLIFASSMAGARKAYCDQPLVTRRIHGKNLYAKENYSSHAKPSYSRRKLYYNNLRRSRMKKFLTDKLGIGASFVNFVDTEFKTIDEPTSDMMQTYMRILNKTHLSLLEKTRKRLSMYRYYLLKKRKISSTNGEPAQYIANKI
ncbi:glycosyl transferase, group 2 family protein [Synechococcus sp. PCC 7335]|uniref:glycosyltransferase family 2 protein n=1 Tax=Synechococcus sp. (strain ATCC 29403 / PCC 7335) TaxID=91464 RepID=UPI00017EDD27|nr:glycosyltransferase family 2 protein [Synechococcus sp. PCC 7335]EDX86693.1 glycosyl transferase, group 2 family protein [Synechococcus sp. PCC 7335]